MICSCGLPIPAGPITRAVTYHHEGELYGILLDCTCGSSHVVPIWMSEELALDLAEFYALEAEREFSSERDSRPTEAA